MYVVEGRIVGQPWRQIGPLESSEDDARDRTERYVLSTRNPREHFRYRRVPMNYKARKPKRKTYKSKSKHR